MTKLQNDVMVRKKGKFSQLFRAVFKKKLANQPGTRKEKNAFKMRNL